MTGPLFLRSQYAYKTAAGMALAGQVVEAFAMMRLCLEYAGYALEIFAASTAENAPTRQEVFLKRHVDDASMKAQKEEFKISNILKVIVSFDVQLANLFKILYDRTIDFGAHPNPSGMLNAMETERSQNSVTYITLEITTDTVSLLHAMENTRQTGLTALFIFQHIFTEKFEQLGIRAEMDALRGATIEW